MADEKTMITRRDFLRAGSCAAVGGLMGVPFATRVQAQSRPRSRVVLIRDKKVIDGSGNVRPEVLESMLDQAVNALLDTRDAVSAWKRLVEPSDVVGIKSNRWYHLRTPEALESAIQMRVREAGVQGKNLSVDDRGVLRNPVFKHCTALINTRPMRTHYWSGLGTLLKNYIMFTPSPPDYHDNACENLGALWQLPHVKGKTRLNILVMLTPQFHGVGPHSFSLDYVWNYGGLIVSRDAVAADATGARILQAKRNDFFESPRPISPPPHHISVADARFKLGNSRPEHIELIKLGWDEGLLI